MFDPLFIYVRRGYMRVPDAVNKATPTHRGLVAVARCVGRSPPRFVVFLLLVVTAAEVRSLYHFITH